jgi:hypothetical protein
MAGGPTGVGGTSNVNFDAMQQLVGAGDMESALLAFGIERAQGMEKLVKAKIADMRERNASIQELQQAMQTIRAAKPTGDGEQTTAASPELAKAMDVLRKNGMALPSGITATNGSKIDQLENCLVELNKVAPKPDKAGTSLQPLPGDAASYPGQARLTDTTCGNLYANGINYHSYVDFVSTGGGKGYDKLERNGAWGDLKNEVNGKIDTLASQPESLKGKKEDFDDLITNMQSKIDELTSNDQLDMIQLQSMVSKQNNSIEMVSNLQNKFAGLKDKIVGNMR